MKSILTSNQCTGDSCLVEVTTPCNPADVTPIISANPFWMQQYVTETLTLPIQKPDIEQINSVDVTVEIIRKVVIRTPRSFSNTTPPVAEPNLEGKLLTGRKLIIEGQLVQKILYTADDPTQPVHSVDFFFPFSSFIVVPEEITITGANGVSTTVDSINVNFTVNACIEDVTACLVDPRTIFKQVVWLLYAVPSQVI